MKTSIVTILALLTTATAVLADGSVFFSNLPNLLSEFPDRNVYLPDGSLVGDAGYVAQLWFDKGQGWEESAPVTTGVSSQKHFLPTRPGQWTPGFVILPGTTNGQTVQLQVRVWNSAGFPDYATAVAAGGIHGASAPFVFMIADFGAVISPFLPRDFVMTNFMGFQLVFGGLHPQIGSFSRNGQLVCTNLEPGLSASVEWAPSVEGPWTNSWVELEAVAVDGTGAIRVNVPMFFRVAMGPNTPSAPPTLATTNPTVMIADHANGEVACDTLAPNTTATIEWAPTRWGPWTNSWTGLDSMLVDSSGMIRVVLPMIYRVRGIPRDPNRVSLTWIPAGTFFMGSPTNEPARQDTETPMTEVTISQGFWMGRYEVTQQEYAAVMGNNPSYFRNGVQPSGSGTGGPVANEERHPVENISWEDATNYCVRLTELARLVGGLPEGWAYRLPTEAEWEYACRAETTNAFHYGPALSSGMANFDGRYEYPPCGGDAESCYNPVGTYLGRTTEVGSYAPNAWGLYDLHGNVAEWCQDWSSPRLPGGTVTDPPGASAGSARAIRGGDWNGHASPCRSAARASADPALGSSTAGLRVVLAPVAGSAP